MIGDTPYDIAAATRAGVTVVAALSLQFDAALRTPQIEAAVDRLEQRVRERHPQVLALFVKPQTQGGFERNLRARYGNDGPHAKPSATDDEP